MDICVILLLTLVTLIVVSIIGLVIWLRLWHYEIPDAENKQMQAGACAKMADEDTMRKIKNW